MKFIKKMIKENKKHKELVQPDLEKNQIEILKKRIITNLRIIESQLQDFDYQMRNFSSLKQEEVLVLYKTLNKFTITTKALYAESTLYEMEKCKNKANEILERLDILQESFTRKMTGFEY